MEETMLIKNQRRIFYGWFIVAVSFLCWFAADAFGWYTFGIFLGPITREFGWTITLFTGAFTLRICIGGLLGPVVGPLVDKKYGARILMSMGVLIAGTVPILVSKMQALWQFYALYGVIGALSMVGFGGLVTNAVIAKWFIRKRGRAMGMAAMGVSTSGLVFVPVCHYLVSQFGWRTTLMILGFIIWGLAFFPVVIFVRRSPEDEGLRPDGDDPAVTVTGSEIRPQEEVASSEEEIWTLKEALRTKALWLLLMGFNIAGIGLSGVFLHFYPYLESKGFSTDVATSAMTTLALFAALVKIPWGMLAEKVQVRYCITACYLGCSLSLLILMNSHSVPIVILYAVAYGITLGGDMVLRELVWANYYGRTFLGTIRGVIMPANLISMAGGPLFGAWLRDITGSYQLPYRIFFILFLAGTFLIFLAKQPIKKSPLHTPAGNTR